MAFNRQEKVTGWVMLLPALLVLGLVFIYPIARAFWLSWFTENLGTQLQPVFAGLGNYQRMLGDGRFWQSLSNTAIFTIISVFLELLLGLGCLLYTSDAADEEL
jgi:multiple sugar transport system permease protein